MIACFAALGAFHLAQQRVHLVDRQPPVRAHRRVARHRREQLVHRRFDAPRALFCREIAEHVAHERLDVAAPRAAAGIAATEIVADRGAQTRSRARRDRRRTPRRDPPPRRRRRASPARAAPAISAMRRRASRFRRSYVIRSCAACMSTMIKPVAILGEHVDAGELREREAERRHVAVLRPRPSRAARA